jgi:benzodiazapine receptor
MTRTRDLLGLVGFVALCLTVAAIGGLATASSVDTWYQALVKPTFNPPDWVFAPVWTILYIAIGVSGWLVWRTAGFKGARTAFVYYALQLALNLAWSFMFFGARQIGALIEVLVLLISIVMTALHFRRHHRGAALLLVPYIAWVSFASLLNAAIWHLN